jgi:hypothetical protein
MAYTYPIRKKDHIKLSRNLFEVYLMPNYRLAFPIYDFLSEAEKLKF